MLVHQFVEGCASLPPTSLSVTILFVLFCVLCIVLSTADPALCDG